jgi:hypothetical protein
MSDTPKHSPGPFTYSVSTHVAGTIACDENTIRDADGCTLIRQWYGSLGHGEYADFVALVPGDWHLFAAAPEMLEVLKKTKQVLESGQVWDRTEGIMMIDEVVAKAEGRQQ